MRALKLWSGKAANASQRQKKQKVVCGFLFLHFVITQQTRDAFYCSKREDGFFQVHGHTIVSLQSWKRK